MQRREFALGTAAALGLGGLWAAPALAQSGQGYAEIKPSAPVDAPPGQVEVIEFFSYGCIHCKNFEPTFQAWKQAAPEHVKVRVVHVGFNPSFEPLQRIFYTLEAMGELGKAHAQVFDAILSERKRLDKLDVLLPWMAERGVDREKFEATYKSFGVATQLRRAAQLQEAYKVEGTPALGIAGRYYTDGSKAGGFERMIQITNRLIEQERQRT